MKLPRRLNLAFSAIENGGLNPVVLGLHPPNKKKKPSSSELKNGDLTAVFLGVANKLMRLFWGLRNSQAFLKLTKRSLKIETSPVGLGSEK